MDNTYHCLECGRSISPGVHDYSSDIFGFPLCLKHQNWLDNCKATKEAIKLYFGLKSNSVPVVLEYYDGRKTIDISIPGKLYIEVNGNYHLEPDQALTDFLRSIHSWKDNIPTFHVSNEHIWNSYYFGIIVDKLTDLSKDLKKTG
jgi:hypothetical protein